MATLPVTYEAASVEAAIKQYVDSCIAGGMATAGVGIEKQLSDAAIIVMQCKEHSDGAKGQVEIVKDAVVDAQSRIDTSVRSANATNEAVKGMYDGLQTLHAGLTQTQTDVKKLYDGIVDMEKNMKDQFKLQEDGCDVQIDRVKEQLETAAKKINDDLITWTATFRTETKGDLARMMEGGNSRGGGGSSSGGHGDKHRGIDKKEIAVWKLPEGDVDKIAFRHWVEAMDVQLELVNDWRYASFVLAHMRRSKVVIDKDALDNCRLIVCNDLGIARGGTYCELHTLASLAKQFEMM